MQPNAERKCWERKLYDGRELKKKRSFFFFLILPWRCSLWSRRKSDDPCERMPSGGPGQCAPSASGPPHRGCSQTGAWTPCTMTQPLQNTRPGVIWSNTPTILLSQSFCNCDVFRLSLFTDLGVGAQSAVCGSSCRTAPSKGTRLWRRPATVCRSDLLSAQHHKADAWRSPAPGSLAELGHTPSWHPVPQVDAQREHKGGVVNASALFLHNFP